MVHENDDRAHVPGRPQVPERDIEPLWPPEEIDGVVTAPPWAAPAQPAVPPWPLPPADAPVPSPQAAPSPPPPATPVPSPQTTPTPSPPATPDPPPQATPTPSPQTFPVPPPPATPMAVPGRGGPPAPAWAASTADVDRAGPAAHPYRPATLHDQPAAPATGPGAIAAPVDDAGPTPIPTWVNGGGDAPANGRTTSPWAQPPQRATVEAATAPVGSAPVDGPQPAVGPGGPVEESPPRLGPFPPSPGVPVPQPPQPQGTGTGTGTGTVYPPVTYPPQPGQPGWYPPGWPPPQPGTPQAASGPSPAGEPAQAGASPHGGVPPQAVRSAQAGVPPPAGMPQPGVPAQPAQPPTSGPPATGTAYPPVPGPPAVGAAYPRAAGPPATGTAYPPLPGTARQPAVPPGVYPEQGWPAPQVVPPTAEDFARRRQVRPVDPVATMGVRAVVNRIGLVRLAPGRHEQEMKRDIEMVRRNFGGLRQVTVVNPKGGAGKTVAILLLAMTFGQKRGGYVLAWDNNETQGTLGMRAQQDFHARTVRDMLRDLGQFQGAQGRVGDLSQYVRSQGEGMFDVLASDESATGGEMLTAAAFAEIRDVVSRFYKLIFVDTGNNVRAQNWQAAMDATDQLVVTMSARNDSAETAARMLDHLEQSGRQRLVRQAVTVVSMPPSRKEIDLPAIQAHFAARTRAVLLAPYERLIDTGEPLRYGQLSAATRDAWLKIAASVAEGL
ncbi:chromosome partitioning protein [Micromonospora sp. RP3T]|uniref:MinD/ParA family ATP-binding protein n=1 Tax=Micromonospora sp. RP3T TaxID=2135446 RepID=UPI000D17168A|nr:chromosome partitioning protein [Micromonospora sp. RP3T]PTA42435.1 chromosome partitioning protein [Micromonospora sp. RP3T]